MTHDPFRHARSNLPSMNESLKLAQQVAVIDSQQRESDVRRFGRRTAPLRMDAQCALFPAEVPDYSDRLDVDE